MVRHRPDLGHDPGALVKAVTLYGADPNEHRIQRFTSHRDVWEKVPAADCRWVKLTGAADRGVPVPCGQVGVCAAGTRHAVVAAWRNALSGRWNSPESPAASAGGGRA